MSRHRGDLSCEGTSDRVVSCRRGSKNRDPFRSTQVESRQLFYVVGQFASRFRLCRCFEKKRFDSPFESQQLKTHERMPSTAQAAGGFYAEAIALFLIYFDSGHLPPGFWRAVDRVSYSA